MNVFSNALSQAQAIMQEACKLGDVAIDMTMGNGKDTVFLADLVKHVFAFDIQQEAHNNTKELLETLHIDNVTCIKDGHENLDLYDFSEVGVIIFNLGYLPRS